MQLASIIAVVVVAFTAVMMMATAVHGQDFSLLVRQKNQRTDFRVDGTIEKVESDSTSTIKEMMRGNSFPSLMRVRGSGASCTYDNSNENDKRFVCNVTFEKKIFTKKVHVSATVILTAHIKTQTIDVEVQVAGKTLYKKTYAMNAVNIPPFCVSLIMDVSLCLALKDIKFNTNAPGCVVFDLSAYLDAFGAKQNLVTQQVGWNVNACKNTRSVENLFLLQPQ
ncbi:hypothetical protein FDP41_000773 [Naegleria fowleri]|uniref:Uncharacterized protein n=1 Tax=Naegleria fowleri TaxID=5763 RepID=A0A6A5CE58_NAEFO|nr:uncharacterized protein FDP41_000773 [Naegleria fowleri]KAF0984874.1 hypothetical protein FDP41_000773 [Naegleria fowleri]CAG4714701.1 unnamed protein product [Naegleria fowleri]